MNKKKESLLYMLLFVLSGILLIFSFLTVMPWYFMPIATVLYAVTFIVYMIQNKKHSNHVGKDK